MFINLALGYLSSIGDVSAERKGISYIVAIVIVRKHTTYAKNNKIEHFKAVTSFPSNRGIVMLQLTTNAINPTIWVGRLGRFVAYDTMYHNSTMKHMLMLAMYTIVWCDELIDELIDELGDELIDELGDELIDAITWRRVVNIVFKSIVAKNPSTL